VVDGFVDVLPKLQASIESFGRFGLIKSKAYSQLPAAMYLARLGDVSGARRMLNSAQRALAEEVRDQDILLNNRAAVELLAEDADYRTCADLLQAALQQATDDYSELTILTNLALALWQGGDLKGAVDRVQRAQRILEHHDFEDRDTYWPVCFNLSQVLAATGDLDGANAMLDFPQERGRPLTVNQNYWAFRYGKTTEVDTVYQFLASRPIHPMYLSRWLIESEGLALLTPEHAL
jgi:tetratricopeptide (TPR) repeat protein